MNRSLLRCHLLLFSLFKIINMMVNSRFLYHRAQNRTSEVDWTPPLKILEAYDDHTRSETTINQHIFEILENEYELAIEAAQSICNVPGNVSCSAQAIWPNECPASIRYRVQKILWDGPVSIVISDNITIITGNMKKYLTRSVAKGFLFS